MSKTKLRTWSDLAKFKRIPSEYEVVTHNLHYNKNLRFELDPNDPVVDWYRKYREGSVIQANDMDDWNQFRDPAQMVYRKYTELQDERETFIDVLFEQDEELRADRKLSPDWAAFLLKAFTPLRYMGHGLQMVASYGTMISPSSYITNAFEFQAADEMRRVQRICYRTKELELEFPELGFGQIERNIWEKDPIWQPLREAIEKLLIEYDFGKSFVGLNLVLKPLVDELVSVKYAELFRLNGDDLMSEMLENFYLDSVRSKNWSGALARFMIGLKPENKNIIQDTVNQYFPLAYRGVLALAPTFETLPPNKMEFEKVIENILEKYSSMLNELQLSVPSAEHS